MFFHYPILLLFFAVQTVRSDDRNPLSAPKSGEAVEAEKTFTIRWTPGSPGGVKIWLAYGNTAPVEISGGGWIQNFGTYGWVPSRSYAGRNDYFLAICDIANVEHDCTNGTEFTIALLARSTSTSVSSTLTTEISSSFWNYSSTTVEPSTSTSPTGAPASPTASETAPTQAPSRKSTLSPGAKIAVGTVLGLVGAGLFGFAALWFWHKRRHSDEDSTTENFIGGDMRPVLHVAGEAEWSRPAELPGRGVPQK